HHIIYYHSADFASRKEIPTFEVYIGSNSKRSETSSERAENLKKNTKYFNAAGEELSAVKHKLMLLDIAAEGRVNTAKVKDPLSKGPPQVVVSAAKLPILNPNEFDLWKMRIEQYFLMTDYSLWEVILNGDSLVPTRIVEGVAQPVAPITVERTRTRLILEMEDQNLSSWSSPCRST
nr:zf-CCHC domain-containing protein/DUF4219 domain-containing protein/UBN2 domain-containing protein [Tanacetum cinerariifolium]